MEYDYREAMKLSNQLCFPLYAAARNVTGLYTPWLKQLGITYTQYITFLVLWEKDGITVGEICERLMLDNGTVSPLLKKMESAGYITRSRSAEDDRVVVITLTEQGREMQDKAKDIPEKVGACIDLSPEKAMKLYGLDGHYTEKDLRRRRWTLMKESHPCASTSSPCFPRCSGGFWAKA